MKLILILLIIALVILFLVYANGNPQSEVSNDTNKESEISGDIDEQRIVNPENVSTGTDSTSTSTQSDGKLKVDFEVNE